MTATFVQSGASGLLNAGSAASSQGLTNPTGAGNTIVVGLQFYGNTATSIVNAASIVDNAAGGSSTFTKAATSDAQRTSTVYGLHTEFYYATAVPATTGYQVTVTPDAATFDFITVYEVSGANYDQSCGATGTNSTNGNVNAGTLTPANTTGVAIFLGVEDGVSADDWTLTGWTSDFHGTAGGAATTSAHQTFSTGAAVAFSVPFTGSPMNWAASGIVFVTPGSPFDPNTLRTLSSPRLV